MTVPITDPNIADFWQPKKYDFKNNYKLISYQSPYNVPNKFQRCIRLQCFWVAVRTRTTVASVQESRAENFSLWHRGLANVNKIVWLIVKWNIVKFLKYKFKITGSTTTNLKHNRQNANQTTMRTQLTLNRCFLDAAIISGYIKEKGEMFTRPKAQSQIHDWSSFLCRLGLKIES